jgi:hypothetical protein
MDLKNLTRRTRQVKIIFCIVTYIFHHDAVMTCGHRAGGEEAHYEGLYRSHMADSIKADATFVILLSPATN